VNHEVGLKLTCPYHGGRLLFTWLDGDGEVQLVPAKGQGFSVASLNGEVLGRPGSTSIIGEGQEGLARVECTRPGCRQQQSVSGQWLEERLRLVAEAFAAGIGPRVVTLPLSEVGARRRRTALQEDAQP
jgi:hypothetical protein